MNFEEILIIYHANCPDGMCAAWCANHFYTEAMERGEAEVTFYGATHGQSPPIKLVKKAHKTFILDFSYSREDMIKISKLTELKVLDHHVKAQEACQDLDFCEFDLNRSGAGIAWDYFFPDVERPWLVDYIETRDIWQWKWPNAEEALAYVDTLPRNFMTYDKIFNGTISLAECVEKGKPVKAYIKTVIEETIEACLRHITFQAPDGSMYVDVPIVNGNCKQISELINYFAPGHLFGLGYFRRKDGKYQYSIRVPEDSPFDGNKFAGLYGGGGHKKAAGFQLYRELEELPVEDADCGESEWQGYKISGCGRKIKGK